MEYFARSFIDRMTALGAAQNVPLSELTTFRIGGPASFVLEPVHEDQIADALNAAYQEGCPVFLLGRGSNLLASDAGYRGLVIRFDRPLFEPVYDGAVVRASAGASLTQLAKDTVSRGLMGLERLCGIPGSLGGACAMNAGAYGAELSDTLTRVKVLNEGKTEWVSIEPGMLGYRKSPFAFPGCVVLEAELRLLPDDGGAAERMRECLAKRKEKQPLEYPSAGSVFKRPAGHFAGALIEQCGLKGLSVGGARVSEKHAGFIVNTGGATARDVETLIGRIRETVLRETGVLLECEIKRMGEGLCIC